jgi:hypothetical protein
MTATDWDAEYPPAPQPGWIAATRAAIEAAPIGDADRARLLDRLEYAKGEYDDRDRSGWRADTALCARLDDITAQIAVLCARVAA